MINVCIIGCGSIGALKADKYDNPDSDSILTHAHALYSLKKRKLINTFYLIESNLEKRQLANKKWGARAFGSLKALYKEYNDIDIFVISTPTETHFKVLTEILKVGFNPKMVIAEKPFCENLQQAKEIRRIYGVRSIPIVIDYIRRFCLTIETLKNELEYEKYGKIQSCNIIYTRGFIRDASHAIDLCNYFFGDFVTGKILGDKSNAYDDYSQQDLTYPAWMEYSKCKNIFLTPADGRNYSIFEMDIITEKARICLIDHTQKTKVFPAIPEPVYGDFKTISYHPVEDITNDITHALYFLHTNCINYLLTNKKKNYNLYCKAIDGVKVHEVYDKLL